MEDKKLTELVIMSDPQAAVAAVLGECIDPHVKTSVEISMLADVLPPAEPGERVYTFQSYDTSADHVLDVNPSTGVITQLAISPTEPVEIKFKELDSNEEYITVTNLLSSEDRKVLARRKVSIARAFDALELRIIINAILDGKTPGMVANNSGQTMEDAVQSVTLETGDDLFRVIAEAKKLVENYGDKFLGLCGTNVKAAYDTYDIDVAKVRNYSPQIAAKVASWGIDMQKIYGTVKWTGGLHNVSSGGYADDSAETAIMDSNKFILEAVNSRIADGKPIKFIRRKVSPDMAALMGADVDGAQRATMAEKCPVQVGSTRVRGISIYSTESIIWTITNAYAIAKTGDLTTYLAQQESAS